MACRAEIARLEEERDTLARKLDRSDSLMGRVGFGSDPATLRAAISDVEKRLRHARHKLEETVRALKRPAARPITWPSNIRSAWAII